MPQTVEPLRAVFRPVETWRNEIRMPHPRRSFIPSRHGRAAHTGGKRYSVLSGLKTDMRDGATGGFRGYRNIVSYSHILIPASQVSATGPSIQQGWRRAHGKLIGGGGLGRTWEGNLGLPEDFESFSRMGLTRLAHRTKGGAEIQDIETHCDPKTPK